MGAQDLSKIRPKPDWVSVLADQRKDRLASGLYIPGEETGAEKVTEGAGTIVRLGAGELAKDLGLEAGQRIVYRSFLRFANRIESDERWPDGSPKEYFFMAIADIMGVLAPGAEVGIFSGRPQVPEREVKV